MYIKPEQILPRQTHLKEVRQKHCGYFWSRLSAHGTGLLYKFAIARFARKFKFDSRIRKSLQIVLALLGRLEWRPSTCNKGQPTLRTNSVTNRIVTKRASDWPFVPTVALDHLRAQSLSLNWNLLVRKLSPYFTNEDNTLETDISRRLMT